MEFKHKSVLLEETVNGLNIKPDGIYVDGTLGGGGHAEEVCKQLNDKGSFIGIDQDAAAIEAATVRLAGLGERVTIIRSNNCDMKTRLRRGQVRKEYCKAYCHGKREGADRDYGAVMRDYPTCNSDEISEEHGTSGKENISGDSY